MVMVHLLSRHVTSGGLLLAISRASALITPPKSLIALTEKVDFQQRRGIRNMQDNFFLPSFDIQRNDKPLFANKSEKADGNLGQKRSKTSKSGGKKKGNNHLFRADKVIASRAGLSRSQATDFLKRRRVAWKKSVEGELLPVKGPKEKLSMDAILYIDGKDVPQLPPILIAYHKPKFMLSAMDEKHSDKRHLGMIFPGQYKKLGIHPVGRLDYDTSGLLLFSREGDLTQRLLHPKYGIDKEYVATVAGGRVDVEALREKLEIDGVVTGEGLHFAKLLEVEEVSLAESHVIRDEHYLKTGSGKEEKEEFLELPLTKVRITVQEGKYRMVRRMLFNCNHPVIELRRERHGQIELGDLKEGEFRDCYENEINWAEQIMDN